MTFGGMVFEGPWQFFGLCAFLLSDLEIWQRHLHYHNLN